ncbi:MAG: glutamate-1-semialdehyde-2,1-aminomutase [Planctomycetes bacterium]|nr:glutamate-1-semialdehyde-2,1-aminomutase [Planctomycetota bacterium]
MRNVKSAKLFNKALQVIPGGVNSPVRAFKSVDAKPIFIEKAKGPHLYDADGNKYIDYCLSWGPMILGHANKDILSDVRKAMAKGTSYGIPTEAETILAEMITKAIASIDKIRLVSSGTEAVMTALRLARGFTGKDKIVKFIGGYHGHVDHMLVSAGSGLATLGAPSSPGVPKDFAKNTIVLPYNDLDAVKKVFAKEGNKIAAIIVEPVAGNMGTIIPPKSFLKGLRSVCTKNKSLLIFDEVISGFRLTYGGYQDIIAVKPDLTTLGKIIGGGFPIGAVGGKKKIMDCLSPLGTVYQAGTLSGNPVCVAAGIATLKMLKSKKPYAKLNRTTEKLCKGITEILAEKSIPHTINQIGSMFTLFFNEGPVKDFDSAAKSDTKRYGSYFRQMLEAGIYIPPSQFEANFVSTTHTQKDFDKTIKAIKKIKV